MNAVVSTPARISVKTCAWRSLLVRVSSGLNIPATSNTLQAVSGMQTARHDAAVGCQMCGHLYKVNPPLLG